MKPPAEPLGAALRALADDVAAPDAGLAERAIAGGARRRRRTVAASAGGITAAVLLVVGVAVGSHHLGAFPPDRLPAGTHSEPTETSPDGDTPVHPTPTGPTMTTTVYLSHGDKARAEGADGCATVYPVQRTVAKSSGVTRAALTELLQGASPEERTQGYTSWFSPATAGALRNVTIKDGTAYVDLADLRSTIPNASTSCGSAAFLAQLTETAKAAARVERVRLAIDGQPALLWGWLQRGCDASNDECDPAPFGTLRYADLPAGPAVHPPYRIERVGSGEAAHYAYVDEVGRVDLPLEAGPTYVVRRAGGPDGTVVLMANGRFFTGGGTNGDRRIYLIGADRTPRLMLRNNIGDVSTSTDGRYIAYLTATPAADLADVYDALVVREVATWTTVATVPTRGKYELTWDGHVVVATSRDPRGTSLAWDVARGAPGDPSLGGGAVAPHALSPDGTRGVRELAVPWPTPRFGRDPGTRVITEVVTFATGHRMHLRAPLSATTSLVDGALWEDDTHVILQDIDAGGDASGQDGPTLVRCDVRTGACEQAPDPQGLYSPR